MGRKRKTGWHLSTADQQTHYFHRGRSHCDKMENIEAFHPETDLTENRLCTACAEEKLGMIEVEVRKTDTRRVPDQKDVLRQHLISLSRKGYEVISVGDRYPVDVCENDGHPVFLEDKPQPFNDITLCNQCLVEHKTEYAEYKAEQKK